MNTPHTVEAFAVQSRRRVKVFIIAAVVVHGHTPARCYQHAEGNPGPGRAIRK